MTLHGRPVVMCDKPTMKVLDRFPSVLVASISTGIPIRRIEGACDKNQVSKGKFVWRYLDSYDPDETFEGRHNRPILVTDTETGEAKAYCSFGEAAKALYTNADYVSLCRSKGRLAYGRYEIAFAR